MKSNLDKTATDTTTVDVIVPDITKSPADDFLSRIFLPPLAPTKEGYPVRLVNYEIRKTKPKDDTTTSKYYMNCNLQVTGEVAPRNVLIFDPVLSAGLRTLKEQFKMPLTATAKDVLEMAKTTEWTIYVVRSTFNDRLEYNFRPTAEESDVAMG